MPSILEIKNTLSPSVFQPAALLREARRQKALAAADVPPSCILDPDGDIVRYLRHTGQAQRFDSWPCYHTQLDTFTLARHTVGIVGSVVGPPFAVIVAKSYLQAAAGCSSASPQPGKLRPPARSRIL